MRKLFLVSVIAMSLSLSQLFCTNPSTPPPKSDDDGVGIAAVTIAADYSSAGFQIVSTSEDSYTVSSNLINSLHTDLVVRAHGSGVYILERWGKDNIIKYDTKAKDNKVAYQQSLGVGLNIQDIAVVSETKAYISCYESAELIVFNPSTGTKTSTIDLSQFNAYAGTDSAEAYPFASALAVYGDNVYIACQRLKTVPTDWGSSFVPADTSVIAIVNWHTDEVVGSITLNKKNRGAMSVFGG
ncbi:MAG: hypothetical protein LBH93_04890, partial [Chitinispirillales bacterium]|nr:hypothetical protein [Chitinispirillales bacterium]